MGEGPEENYWDLTAIPDSGPSPSPPGPACQSENADNFGGVRVKRGWSDGRGIDRGPLFRKRSVSFDF